MKRRFTFDLRFEYEPGNGPWHVMFRHYGVARLPTTDTTEVFRDGFIASAVIAKSIIEIAQR